jgi:hypothetical protein
MASSSRRVLVSKEIREQLHDDSDSISKLVRIQTVTYANVGGDDSAINDDGMVVFVVVVTRTKTMIMTIVLSGTKVTMVYV